MELLPQIRARVEGKLALFVSNRTDPDLQRCLEKNLGLRIIWCEGTTRRLEALSASICRGGYDLVLCASGFQKHATDRVLVSATRKAGIPYLRVNKGRLNACIEAFARTFGLRVTKQP